MGAVLRAAIRVVNTAWWRAAQGNSHVQRPDRQILFHPVADSPANHAPREQVDDDGQINPALTRPDVGDVARPLLVRGTRRKVLLQEVRRDVEGVIAVGGALELRLRMMRMPFWRIRRPTRRCPTRRPSSFSSSVIRGLP